MECHLVVAPLNDLHILLVVVQGGELVQGCFGRLPALVQSQVVIVTRNLVLLDCNICL